MTDAEDDGPHIFNRGDIIMTILFYAPQMEALAREIQETSTRARTDGTFVGLGKISWERFSDGTPDLHIMDPEGVRGEDVVFLASFVDERRDAQPDLFEQLAVIYALPRYHARSLRVILPYFPFGTMERVDHPGRIATAMTAARMLGAIPHCHGSGPARIITYDIHALPEQFFFPDNVTVDLRSAMPLMLGALGKTNISAIAFPDEGAAKRFGDGWDDYELITCGKRRNGDKRAVTITGGKPKDQHVLIVDDNAQTCGTTVECRHALIADGALSVSVFVTHGVMPHRSYEKLTSRLFERVWITNSCPATAERVHVYDHFDVLSLAPLIAQDLT